MPSTGHRRSRADIDNFALALSKLLRGYQFRDRDRQMVCGITVTQCYALEFLVNEGRLTVLDVGRRLVLNKSNASRVVEALESAGLVSRANDPANHRIRWIEPTPVGRALHARIATGLKHAYQSILEPFPPAFVRRVTALLEALAEYARQRRDGASGAPLPSTGRSAGFGRSAKAVSTSSRRRPSARP